MTLKERFQIAFSNGLMGFLRFCVTIIMISIGLLLLYSGCLSGLGSFFHNIMLIILGIASVAGGIKMAIFSFRTQFWGEREF